MRRVFLVLCSCLMLMSPCGVSANLVVNPGFETGDFGLWTQSGNTDFTFVDGIPRSGTQAAWLGAPDDRGFLSQSLLTTPGQRYDLSFWLRHNPFGTGTPSEFQVFWDGAMIDDRTDLDTFPYTESVYASVLATGDSTELKFGFREDTDYFQLDDVSVEPVPLVGTKPSMLPTPLWGSFGSPQPNPVTAVFSDPPAGPAGPDSDSLSLSVLGFDPLIFNLAEEEEDAGGFLWLRFPRTNWLFQAFYLAPGDGVAFLNYGTNADILFASDIGTDGVDVEGPLPPRFLALIPPGLDPIAVTEGADGNLALSSLPPFASVPEPSTRLLLACALAVLLATTRWHGRLRIIALRLDSSPHREEEPSTKPVNFRSLRLSIVVIVVAAFGWFTAADCLHAQGITDFSPEGIQRFLNDNPGVRSPAKFLESLPAEFKQNWIMMTHSESAQTGTAASPRFILPNAATTLVFGFALDSNTIEYLQVESSTNKFRFHSISTADGTLTADDRSCLACHASSVHDVKPGLPRLPRPNWDAYDSWGGMLPFNRDRIYQDSLEQVSFESILTDLKDDAIVVQLELPKGVSRDASGLVKIAFDPCDPGIGGAPPCKTDTGSGNVNVTYDQDPDGDVTFPGSEGPIAVAQGGKYLRLFQSIKGDNTDEGRGVALFDNFTANNAKRVAQELLDFPRDPVDIRYVALAIAEGCVAARTLGKYAPKESLDKLLAYQTMLDAVVKAFPDLVADTRKRQEGLPQQKADLEAKNLSELIIANGGEVTPEAIAMDIARRSKTNPLQTFELDKLTGFMIDRELYDTNNETLKIAMFRLYLEPLGVAVDNWSMSVNSIDTGAERSRTYTFGDLFNSNYIPRLTSELTTSLAPHPVTCSDLAAASIKQYVKGYAPGR